MPRGFDSGVPGYHPSGPGIKSLYEALRCLSVDFNLQMNSYTRSLALIFWLSLLSWPHAAMISRPRGVRTGEA
jgi:membrane protein required for beta-lactamase induction